MGVLAVTFLAIGNFILVARVVVVDPATGARLGGVRQFGKDHGHSSNLLRLCAEVLEAIWLWAPALGVTCVWRGPGSFTGWCSGRGWP